MSGKSKKSDVAHATAGQPTKYKQEYCAKLVEHMAAGKGYATFAPKVEVHRDTLYAWEKDHEEWAEAKKIAFDACEAWWEKQGIDGLYSHTEYENGKPISSRSINATVWIFNMKNRFKWRDKQPDEKEVVVNNFTQISDEDLDAKIKKLQGVK